MRASTGRHGMETPGDCGPSWLWRLWPSAGGVTHGVPSGGLIYLPVRHAVPPVATVVVAEIADDVVVELLPLQPNEREGGTLRGEALDALRANDERDPLSARRPRFDPCGLAQDPR